MTARAPAATPSPNGSRSCRAGAGRRWLSPVQQSAARADQSIEIARIISLEPDPLRIGVTVGNNSTSIPEDGEVALRDVGAEVGTAVGLDDALARLERCGLLRGSAGVPSDDVSHSRPVSCIPDRGPYARPLEHATHDRARRHRITVREVGTAATGPPEHSRRDHHRARPPGWAVADGLDQDDRRGRVCVAPGGDR
jgi:hypothetical protein